MSDSSNVKITKHFEDLTDPRCELMCTHSILNIAVLAVCAVIGNANTWVEVERFCKLHEKLFARFLDLSNGIPSHDTFSRVFRLLDTHSFHNCLRRWTEALNIATKGEFIALDGKTLRGSFDKATGNSCLHVVSAWATKHRAVLGQVAVDDKSNEITAIPKLLELIEIAGGIVTVDAMNTQKEIARKIQEKNADYIMAVKDNHHNLLKAISDEFIRLTDIDFNEDNVRRLVRNEKGHGRIERREYTTAPIPDSMLEAKEWEGARSIGMAVSTREINGKSEIAIRYFITSLEPYVRKFSAGVRNHWNIENKLHWSLDVTFAEDASRIRKDNGPENMGNLRRFVLSYLQQDTTFKDNIRGKRQCAGWSEKVLLQILTGKKADI